MTDTTAARLAEIRAWNESNIRCAELAGMKEPHAYDRAIRDLLAAVDSRDAVIAEAEALYAKIAKILEDDGCNCEGGGDSESGDSGPEYRCSNHRIEDALRNYRDRVAARPLTKETR